MAKVSLIVPCHNSAEYIDKCLERIEGQTIGMDNLEIILVDDASSDDGKTLDALLAFEQKHTENTIVIPLKDNLRQGGARNTGIQYASGEYIAFCDSDDWLLYGALECLYNTAREYDADVVEFDLYAVFDNKITSDEERQYELESRKEPNVVLVKSIETAEERKANLFRTDSTNGHPTKLYRASMIKDNDIRFPEHVAMEEPGFTIQVRFFEKKYVRIHNYLYINYIHQNSTTRSPYEAMKFHNAITHMFLYEELKRKGFLVDYSEEIEYLFWYWYYLNTLLFAIHNKTFFTEDEYRVFYENVRSRVSNIGNNQYFIKYWGAIPQLAQITYIDPAAVGIDTLHDVFIKLNELC